MKRLLTITVLGWLTLTGLASAATLKPVATPADWGSSPIFATAPPNDPRLFVVERGEGAPSNTADIRIVKNGVLQAQPFLTVPNVDISTERGLLSMAFAPDYATSGLFYVFWVANGDDAVDPGVGQAGDIRIVEFKRSAANPDLADPNSARLVLKRAHSAGNHNGGWMAFGPDGTLYFTIGDNANSLNAQSLNNLFGKVSRIDPADPDGAGPQTRTIPADNPFVTTPGAEDEIYTYGLRNPYRASFAPDGRLVIGDVGQNATEEVDVGNLAGKNLGWPNCEGTCAAPNPAFYEPFFTYEHSPTTPTPVPGTGNVIIGGYVVRDPDLTGLTGRYIYGDNQRTDLRTLNLSVPGGDPVDPGLSVDNQYSLLSFGEDSRGCTYVMADNNVYRIAASAAATANCPHATDVPDPPDPPVDSTRPGLNLGGKPQRLGKKIAFYATCDEACEITGKGALKAKRHGRKKAVGFRYSATTRDAAAGTKVKLVLRLKTKPLKNARKVFHSGRSLRASLVATASDPSGNRRAVTLRLKIKR